MTQFYSNKYDEQGDLFELNSNTHIFNYTKFQDLVILDIETNKSGSIRKYTELEIYITHFEIYSNCDTGSSTTAGQFR